MSKKRHFAVGYFGCLLGFFAFILGLFSLIQKDRYSIYLLITGIILMIIGKIILPKRENRK